MARQRKCRVCGGWHDLDGAWPYDCRHHNAPRKAPATSFPCPRLVRPFSDPVQSMADGKYYDDQAALRKTYKASGNPQGVDYVEVGNEDVTTFTAPKMDRKENRDAIDRAIADVDAGRAPPVLDQLPI